MSKETSISRRDVLKFGAATAIGMAIGASGMGALAKSSSTFKTNTTAESRNIPFYGDNQLGILTGDQSDFVFAAFDFQSNDRAEGKKLLREWTDICEQMTDGKMLGVNEQQNLVPDDTGEAIGLSPSRLTLTFGYGASFFDRFGITKPIGLVNIPKMPGDQLQQDRSNGDIGVFVGADDPQVAFYAIRNLARIAHGIASIRWIQKGFTSGLKGETPRNLFGFKDGTANLDVKNKDLMNQHVWVKADNQPTWMQGGSYMVARRIQMHTEVWDRLTLKNQEDTFGRVKSTGAPMGKTKEFDEVTVDSLPERSHVRLAREVQTKILRRGFSYMDGLDAKTGRMDAGLFFISFQQDVGKQLIPMLAKMASSDKLNEYVTHTSNAVFACPRGFKKGSSIGEGIF